MSQLADQFVVYVDYVKYVFRSGWENNQNFYVPAWENALARLPYLGPNCGGAKMSVLPGTDSQGRTRYVYEAWGKMADHLWELLPTVWVNALYRLDIREELPTITEDHIAALQTSISLGSKGAVNTFMLNSRPRQKTNQRDVGGRGVQFGSRKSDQHLVIYKRGNEAAAVEYRIQNKKINEMTRASYLSWQNEHVSDVWQEIVANAMTMRATYQQKALGVSGTPGLTGLLDMHKSRATQLRQALQFTETAEEREYWEGLSEEEQEQFQKDTFWPDFTKL